MIILIDNYDSFSYNLYQLAGSLYPDIKVIRNDALSLPELEEMNPKALLISPGPGRPEDAGICVDAIRFFGPRIPILGVCLGHQAICQCYGATVSYAKELVHGKAYDVEVDTESPLFRGMKSPIKAARYHSLAAVESTLPENHRLYQRRGNHGRGTQGLSHLRPPIPSRIHYDPGRRKNPEKLLHPSGKGRKIVS